MNLNLRILLITVVLVAAGCATSPRATTREPYVKPGLVMLTSEQAERRGIRLADTPLPPPPPPHPGDASAVTSSGVVKVYTVGRSVDPADPTLMHEEHVVYRRDVSPGWRLDAPADQKIIVGPRITDGRQDLQPLLAKELTSFLADQRRATDANQKAIAALFEAVEALNRQQQVILRRGVKPVAAADANSPAATTGAAEDGQSE